MSGTRFFERAKTALFSIAVIALGLVLGWVVTSTVHNRLASPPPPVKGDFSAVVAESPSPLVLFSKSTCPHCQHAKALLDQLHADYTVYEIDRSDEARARFEALDLEAVPVLFTADTRIVGFDAKAYRAQLSR